MRFAHGSVKGWVYLEAILNKDLCYLLRPLLGEVSQHILFSKLLQSCYISDSDIADIQWWYLTATAGIEIDSKYHGIS